MYYINTLMIQRVLTEPDWTRRMRPEDLRALTPFIYSHVTPYGTFRLDMNQRLAIEQGSNTRCYTVGSMKNNTANEGKGGEAKAKPEVIQLGLDLHGWQVTECRQLDGSTPKASVQKWDPWKLLNQVEDWVKAGIKAPAGWWRPAAWQQFKGQLPDWLTQQLEYWQQEALAIDAKERKMRSELEQMVTVSLPIGVGELSWIILTLELRGWDRFNNRRQIASYTGLCPGIHNSNGHGREGSINRCGNSVVRYTLIEMAWRFLRWQPDYPPLKKLREADWQIGGNQRPPDPIGLDSALQRP